jgi:hypothetical protein
MEDDSRRDFVKFLIGVVQACTTPTSVIFIIYLFCLRVYCLGGLCPTMDVLDMQTDLQPFCERCPELNYSLLSCSAWIWSKK